MVLVGLVVMALAVGIYVLMAGASIAGSLGTIADELRRLNDHLQGPSA